MSTNNILLLVTRSLRTPKTLKESNRREIRVPISEFRKDR